MANHILDLNERVAHRNGKQAEKAMKVLLAILMLCLYAYLFIHG